MAYEVQDTSNPCNECLLNGRCVDPSGTKDARFLVVTKGVSKSLVGKGSNISSGSKTILARYMKKYQFSRDEIVFTSAVRCGYDPTRHAAPDRRKIEACCRVRLVNLINQMRPEVVIPLGADAAKAVVGRAVKITKAAGVPIDNEEHKCVVLPMIDPAIVHIRPEMESVFDSDVRALATLLDHSYNIEDAANAAIGDYSIVKDLQFLVDANPKELAIDVETVGTEYYQSHKDLLTIQLCVEPGVAYLIPWDHPDDPLPTPTKNKIRRQLRRLLTNPKTEIIGQGGKFDAAWLLSRLGLKYRMSHDTMMLAAVHDENLARKDLDMLTKLYVPALGGYADAFNATYDKSRMDLVPLTKIVRYACADSDACLQVYHVLRPLVEEDPKLWQSYTKVAMPGLNAFLYMEIDGMLVDTNALDEFEAVLAAHVEELRASLMRQVPRAVKRDHVEKGLAFSRQDFLRDILFTHPKGFRLRPTVFTKSTVNLDPEFQVPSTSSKDHLPYFFDQCPFTEELARYVKLNRLLGTNVRKFRENYIQPNGRIYPIYGLAHAVTARSNCRNPNAANFPSRGELAKPYKRIFVAPPRMYTVGCDLSQAELRIVAELSGDPTMIDLYQTGGDIHRRTAASVMGITEQQFLLLPKEEQGLARYNAKALNFGCIAEGQLVLTDKGEIPIESVTTRHLVWDGVEWVHHDGVIFKGYQEVITYGPLTATQDHSIYQQGTEETVEFGTFAVEGYHGCFSISGNGELPIRVNIGSPKSSSKDKGGEGHTELQGEHGHSGGLPTRVERVYDILNAGPRHRFTVSGVLVHNCVYGAWWTTYKRYAKTQYGLDLTDTQAKSQRQAFFNTYTEVEPLHVAMRSFAHEHGYVRCIDGRIRHLPMIYSPDEKIVQQAERQAINSPVQGFASNLSVMAIARLNQQVDSKYLKVTQFIHDAIYAYVPEEYVLWAAQTLKRYMETNPIEEWFGRKMRVPIVADAGFGKNAGDFVDLPGLTTGTHDGYDFANAFEEAGIHYDLPPQKIPPRKGRIIVPAHLDLGVSDDE